MARCLVLLILAGQLTACCRAPDEYAVSVSAVDSLSFAQPDRTLRLHTGGRVGEAEVGARFRPLYNAIRSGSDDATAVVITLAERDPATDELYTLTLAIPASLRRGERYPLSGVLPPNPGSSGPWGTQALRQAGHAEVAFSTSTYSFPPPLHTPTFVATGGTGTIEVVERGTGWFAVQLSLQLSDATGRTVQISGRVQAQAERYTPPCT